MKALDAGAYAVICPMVNSREDAERLVAWTHYAPRGTRSFGPVRALRTAAPTIRSMPTTPSSSSR